MLKKIAVVDDCQDTLNILGVFLKKAGFRVQVEKTGQGALQKIKEDPPDLILLDMMMPGMDGLEVCRVLKADPQVKDIPIFMFSGAADPSAQEKALQAGVIRFIAKPAFPKDILHKIKAYFDEPSHGIPSKSPSWPFYYRFCI
jgi:two-component system NtrC family sensor kinase